VFDRVKAQLWDLVKTRHPGRRLDETEHHALVEQLLAGRPDVEYGVWAYYPWSNRLVHLLDEAEFVELRTNRNCYKISPDERDRLARKRIGVVGLSVGQSVALVLALERSFAQLRVADFDTLDLSNLNRLRAGVHNLGVPKVLVTAREIAEIDPFLDVVCFPEGITNENMEAFLCDGAPLDLLIEECDSIDLKIELRYAARRHRIPVLMDTSDRGLLDIERFDLEADRPIFHGAVGDLDSSRLRGLTTEEKVPYVLKIIGADTMSTRLRASLLEVQQSISTWPQLASSVAMGGAVTADVARRMLLGQQTASGRFFIDVEEIVPNAEEAPPGRRVEAPTPATDLRGIADGLPPVASGRDLTPAQVRRLVTAATLAPSGGNSQPWRWLWRERRLCVFLDASRSRSLLDFRSLAAVAAVGAAAENLVIAAHAEGFGVRLNALPLGNESELLAIFEFIERGGSGDEPSTPDALVDWIPARVTNRRNATREPLTAEAYAALDGSIAPWPEARLRWLRAGRDLTDAGELLGAGDRLVFLDGRLHAEMTSEVRFDSTGNRSNGRGIPVETLELSPSDRAGLEVSRSWPALALVKEWGGGANLETMSRKAVAAASAVGMITMGAGGRRGYFRGGRAFERLWLTAAEAGLALQPMTALAYLFARLHEGGGEALDPDIVGKLRALWPRWSALFKVDEREAEVLVFRVSRAAPPSARAPRCALSDILDIC
jgi:molybdopterin/thiamine biosynthesis adenylyltransferase